MNKMSHKEAEEKPLYNWTRKAKTDDAFVIAKINYDGWTKNFRGIIDSEYLDTRDINRREMKIKDTLNNLESETEFLVYEKEGKILWFIHGGKSRNDNLSYDNEIYTIYVAHEAQGQGIGKILMNALMETDIFKNKKSFFLVTLRDQKSTRAFYEKMWGKVFLEERKEIGWKIYSMVYYWRQK